MEKVNRQDFIKQRRMAINEAKRFPDLIILDPGDTCVCDFCNTEVVDETLNIHDKDLLCPSCSEAAQGDEYARSF